MPRKKITSEEEFQVHIDKDPKNPDNYKPAEWTKDRKHSYWLNYYLARKQEIEAEEQFVKTGNPEFLRKAKLYTYYKHKLIYEGINLEAKQAPYLEIDKEPTTLTIWPPRPTTDELLDTCETEEKELERIFGRKYSVVLRSTESTKRKRNPRDQPETNNKRTKITPPKKTPARTSIINLIDNRPIPTGAEPPKTNSSKQTKHQKTKTAGKTPSPIDTNLSWKDLQPYTFTSLSNTSEITSHQPVREPSFLTSPNLENNY